MELLTANASICFTLTVCFVVSSHLKYWTLYGLFSAKRRKEFLLFDIRKTSVAYLGDDWELELDKISSSDISVISLHLIVHLVVFWFLNEVHVPY